MKVYIRHDVAPSHTAKATQNFLKRMAKRDEFPYIQNADIPVKRADASPCDFWLFGRVKLRTQPLKTVKALWKATKEEVSKIGSDECDRVMDAWAERCIQVDENDGAQFQNTKDIHDPSTLTFLGIPHV